MKSKKLLKYCNTIFDGLTQKKCKEVKTRCKYCNNSQENYSLIHNYDIKELVYGKKKYIDVFIDANSIVFGTRGNDCITIDKQKTIAYCPMCR